VSVEKVKSSIGWRADGADLEGNPADRCDIRRWCAHLLLNAEPLPTTFHRSIDES